MFNEKIPGEGPNLEELSKALFRISKRMSLETGGEDAGEEEAGVDESGETTAGANAPAPSGGITNNADVERAIDKIVAYYAANEPSSPVPLVLMRAKRMVGADFMAIMKDIAPDGLRNVESVSGITDDDD